MLYSLVFALIYFAVLSIIIIFDMKNRKIKKNLRKIIQRHEDEAKEKIKLGILAADTVYRERTETGTVFYEVPKNLKKSVVLNIICFTIIEILMFSGIKIGILLLLSCAVISITYGNKYYYPKEKTKDTLEIINEDFYLNGKLLDIKGYNWGTELFPLFGTRIIRSKSHIYLLDGKKEIPYIEDDDPNPLSKYAISKYEGEKAVLTDWEKSFVIRTSWLFGKNGENFNTQVINWSKTRDKLSIVDDQISAPTYSKDLAEFSWKLIQTEQFGLYHITNNGIASKYEQAKYVLEKIGWKGTLETAKTEDFNLPAKRPHFSMLILLNDASV